MKKNNRNFFVTTQQIMLLNISAVRFKLPDTQLVRIMGIN